MPSPRVTPSPFDRTGAATAAAPGAAQVAGVDRQLAAVPDAAVVPNPSVS